MSHGTRLIPYLLAKRFLSQRMIIRLIFFRMKIFCLWEVKWKYLTFSFIFRPTRSKNCPNWLSLLIFVNAVMKEKFTKSRKKLGWCMIKVIKIFGWFTKIAYIYWALNREKCKGNTIQSWSIQLLDVLQLRIRNTYTFSQVPVSKDVVS